MNVFAIAERQESGIGPHSEVTPGKLRELANAVEAIIVSAYDGNGFVVWVAA